MLRISQTATDIEITLRLEGEINGRWVGELRREFVRALDDARDGRRLVLDLAGVSSIDSAGLALIRELRTPAVSVTNCSPYVAELLKSAIGR